MRRFSVLLVILAGLAGPVFAQDREQTLADIRQELSMLYVEVQRLKRELNTTGAASTGVSGSTMLDRVNSIEAEMTRLIAKTEQLEYRVDRIVRDGTNRIGDLEFRLVELEGGDISQLGETTTLGGGDLPSGPAMPVEVPGSGDSGQLAVGEKTDFDAAVALLEGEDYGDAAARFETFTATYPGSPLAGEAHYLRGQALIELGQTSQAARAFLTSFSGEPDGNRAPDALLGLGLALGELGQLREACVTLAEVPKRFPSADAAIEANSARQNLGCN